MDLKKPPETVSNCFCLLYSQGHTINISCICTVSVILLHSNKRYHMFFQLEKNVPMDMGVWWEQRSAYDYWVATVVYEWVSVCSLIRVFHGCLITSKICLYTCMSTDPYALRSAFLNLQATSVSTQQHQSSNEHCSVIPNCRVFVTCMEKCTSKHYDSSALNLSEVSWKLMRLLHNHCRSRSDWVYVHVDQDLHW